MSNLKSNENYSPLSYSLLKILTYVVLTISSLLIIGGFIGVICCLPSESAGRCLIPVAIGLGLLFASIPFFFFTDIIESHMLINNHLTKLNESISMLNNNTVRYLAYQNAQLCNIAKSLKLATTKD